jgi:hypothetical protein
MFGYHPKYPYRMRRKDSKKNNTRQYTKSTIVLQKTIFS